MRDATSDFTVVSRKERKSRTVTVTESYSNRRRRQQQLMQQHVGEAEREVSPTCGQFPRPAFGPHGATVSPLSRSFSLSPLSFSPFWNVVQALLSLFLLVFLHFPPSVFFFLFFFRKNFQYQKTKRKKTTLSLQHCQSVSQSWIPSHMRNSSCALLAASDRRRKRQRRGRTRGKVLGRC